MQMKTMLGCLLVAMIGCAPPAGDGPMRPLESVDLTDGPAFPLPAHLESADITAGTTTVSQLVDAGAELFNTPYNGHDGVGMMRTAGGTPLQRFSVGPAGGGQPTPVGAQSCGSCHAEPFAGGYGLAHTRVLVDPNADGAQPFMARATTSLYGNGLLQLLAQEMTEELQAARDELMEEARGAPGQRVTRDLAAKDVTFGTLAATANAAGEVTVDSSGVRGVLADLVVRPFGWKGNVTTVRAFQVLAGMGAMGMMPEEFVWRLPEAAGTDPDGDGVERELSVGDITAMALYNASLETPVSVERLAALGMVAAPSADDLARVEQGRARFESIGCTECHRPSLHLDSTVFEEPTSAGNGNYMDAFLASRDANYDPTRPARIDLAADAKPPRIEADPAGGASVPLYGDLRRHRMGRQLADTVGPVAPFTASLTPVTIDDQVALIDPAEFVTAELWGVGNTGPWLHDDRAGSLDEAIRLHGEDDPPAAGDPARSEAQDARDAYAALPDAEREAVVMFLRSLHSYSPRRGATE